MTAQQLMARHHVDVAQAFSMLVAMAKEQHESIEAVARELVAQDPAGEPDAVLP